MTAFDRGIFISKVLRRRELCREHFQLTLALDRFPTAAPGQFLQVLCRNPNDNPQADAGSAMLRRPFSVAGLSRFTSQVEIDIIGRVVGSGTAWLNARREADEVDLLGPLGNSFSMPLQGERALLIAGGVGLPPIRWMGEILRKTGHLCDAFYGAQSRDLIPLTLITEPSREGKLSPCAEEFSRDNIALAVSTDDGSCGFKGRVTEPLLRYLDQARERFRVYACGPEPMLKAVAQICIQRAIPCELAMERIMGCGMTTCQSCVVPITDDARPEGWRYALCCRDGSVFEANKLVWNVKKL